MDVKKADDQAKKIAIEKMQAAIKADKTTKVDKPERQVTNKSLEKDIRQKKTEIQLVKIFSPFKTYFQGPALSLSAENKTGPFDVLAGHKNFLTLVVPGVVTVRTKDREENIKIDRGVLHVRDNRASLFLDI